MKKFILSFAALAVVVGCENKKGLEQPQTSEVSIVASAADSKTILEGDLVKWEAGDAIALRFAGGDGVYTQNLTTSESGTTVTFTGNLDDAVNVENGYAETGYAVYPSSVVVDAAGNVSYYLNTEVAVLENGSFAPGTNLSSASVSLADLNATGTTSAAFKNALSIVRFTLDADVKKVQIIASENLAGKASMAFDEEGRLCVSEFKSGSKTMTILPQGDSFTEGKVYNVLVYPGTYNMLTVLLTDVDDLVYSKNLSGEFVFKPSEYYTFSFNTKFEKPYQFTGAGVQFTDNVDKIMTVYSACGEVLHEEELTALDNVFKGNLPSSVVNGTEVTGFAVFPSTAYNIATDVISYNLPAEVTASTALASLYSAKLYVDVEVANFTGVEAALSKLIFDLPAGINTVSVESATNFVGNAQMTVNADGQLVAGMGDANKVIIKANGTSGEYAVYVYSMEGADLTLTFTNMEDKSITKTVKAVDIPETGEVPVGNLVFGTNGSFTADGFDNGGTLEF